MRVFLLLLLLSPIPALADGWTFIKGRFPVGKVTVFKLTGAQKAQLELIRRCHTDNTKTPFLFRVLAMLPSWVGHTPLPMLIFAGFG